MNKLTPLGQTTLNFFRDSVEEGHLELFDALIDELTNKPCEKNKDEESLLNDLCITLRIEPDDYKDKSQKAVVLEAIELAMKQNDSLIQFWKDVSKTLNPFTHGEEPQPLLLLTQELDRRLKEPKTPDERKVLFEKEIVFNKNRTLEFQAAISPSRLYEYHGKPMRVTVYDEVVYDEVEA